MPDVRCRSSGAGAGAVVPALVVVALAAGDGIPRTARAGVPAEGAPFATVAIALDVVTDVNRDALHEVWDPRPGAELTIATPLPRGFLDIAARAQSHAARRAGLRDFRSLSAFAGWGVQAPLPGGLLLRPSARVGFAWMLFEETPPARDDPDESEAAVGARLALLRGVGGRWAVEGVVQATRLLTRPEIDLVYVGLGIARTLESPAWLRSFLE
jgi:hypothetical protein